MVTPTPIASGSEFQINTYTSGDQNEATISALGNGGFVVTWASYGQGGVGANIYAQIYDSTGAAVGGEFKVNTDLTQIWQQTPSVTGLDDGGFVITWQSFLQDGSENGIFGQRYDSAGVATGGEFAVNTTTVNWQWESVVTPLADGGFVVSWSTFMQDGDSTGIAGQRYDATGTPVGDEFLVNTYTTGTQQRPDIAGLSDGGFIVTWVSQGQDEAGNLDGYGVYGQRYDATGAAAGGEFLINTNTVNDQAFSSVSALPNGGFVVAWASYDPDGPRYDIYSQVYDATGAPSGAEFLVNSASDGRQLFPSITALGDGGFVIVWNSEEGEAASSVDSIYDINGQRYDAAGQAVGEAFVINTNLDGNQFNPVVTTLSNGDFVVSWESVGQDATTGSGVIGRIFSVDQTLTGTAGDDSLTGGGGNDILRGLAGDDDLEGGTGKDILRGDQGEDALDGGSGRDTAVYANSTAGVNVDLAAGTGSGGDAQGDTFTSIERLIGSDFDDSLAGDSKFNFLSGRDGDDSLSGGAGKDFLKGGAGADTLDGGSGRDTATYANSAAGVNVDLAAGTTSGGNAQGDTLTSIEKLIGSAFDDVLTGNGKRNTLTGNDGDDTLSGGGGKDIFKGGVGADTLDGGKGRDTADYAASAAAVSIDLAAGTASGGNAQGDTLTSIEKLIGSAFDDVLTGNGKRNTLTGNDGDDVLAGGRGDDRLTGGTGADTFVFADKTRSDQVTDYQVGTDILSFDDALWGETLLTNAEVVSQFASVVGANVVFDFGGGNSVTLTGVSDTAGLADDLMIF